jgi:hypothetical protein
MKTIIHTAALATAAVVLAAGLAQAGGIKIDKSVLLGQTVPVVKVAGCQVAGTPSEFPNDVWIINKGLGTINAGTKVKWNLPGYSSYQGTHTLVASLNPGQGVLLNNVLPNGVEAGHACTAKIA